MAQNSKAGGRNAQTAQKAQPLKKETTLRAREVSAVEFVAFWDKKENLSKPDFSGADNERETRGKTKKEQRKNTETRRDLGDGN